MESDIRLLELAEGIKDALVNSELLSIKSILDNTSADISQRVGMDSYIAQIILQEAKRVSTKMAAPPVVYDLSPPDNATPTAVAVEKREITEP